MPRRDTQLCEASMARIRQALNAPPPEAVAWRSITKQHRVYLLMAAGITAERHVDGWHSFSDTDRAKISAQVKAGADLARRWSSVYWRDNAAPDDGFN